MRVSLSCNHLTVASIHIIANYGLIHTITWIISESTKKQRKEEIKCPQNKYPSSPLLCTRWRPYRSEGTILLSLCLMSLCAFFHLVSNNLKWKQSFLTKFFMLATILPCLANSRIIDSATSSRVMLICSCNPLYIISLWTARVGISLYENWNCHGLRKEKYTTM